MKYYQGYYNNWRYKKSHKPDYVKIGLFLIIYGLILIQLNKVL
jgi:hypothetical protein